MGNVEKVNLIKNSLGQNSGKALVTFEKEDSVDKAVNTFHNIAVDSEINLVRPFYEIKGEGKRNQTNLL